MTDGYEWVPTPVGSHYGGGTRWRLLYCGTEVGRVVQLIPGGLWEARTGDTWTAWYSPGHLTLRDASRALWLHLNPGAARAVERREAIARGLRRLP